MCEEKRIVELREIYSCLALSTNIGAKAFMTFILSSGMDRQQAKELTIGDLINSCHVNTIDELLSRNPDNIIPVWIKQDDDKFKLNFSSPESLFYIFLHLKERNDGKSLKVEDKLFDISDNMIDDTFKISERLTDMGSYNPFSKGVGEVSHKFTTKTLKKFFINQYLKHAPDYDNGKQRKYDGKLYSQYKVNLIKLFTSGLPQNDEYCNKFRNNKTRLLLDYKTVLPYITAKNYDCIRPSWNEISDFEVDFNANVDKLMESNYESFTDIDVTQIVVNYVKYNSNQNKVNTLQLIDFALEDNKIGYFTNSKSYLDNLLLKPSLKKDLEDVIVEDIELHPLTYEPEVRELLSKLDTIDFYDNYDIDKCTLAYNIINYLESIEDKGKQMYLTIMDLVELCFESKMHVMK